MLMSISYLGCYECDNGSSNCLNHPLVSGSTKVLHQMSLRGMGWGDMIVRAEMANLERLSVAEKKLYDEKKAKEKLVWEEGVRENMIQKKERIYAKEGRVNCKFNTPCNKQSEHGKVCPNKGTDTSKCLKEHACGCWQHPNKCGFVHVEEHEYYAPIFAAFNVPWQSTPHHNCLQVSGVGENGMLILVKEKLQNKGKENGKRVFKTY